MKKILFTIAIVLTIGISANAQGKNDAYITEWDNSGSNGWRDALSLSLPTGALGGINGDVEAPLGSGLLVLTALGAGYAVARKKSKK